MVWQVEVKRLNGQSQAKARLCACVRACVHVLTSLLTSSLKRAGLMM